MMQLRPSCTGDVPRLKQLWKLAFGDEDSYIDHFFARYYRPERMLVLEEDGGVQAMTAWFDMPLVSARGEEYPAAYLYAVATDPDRRGRGLAGKLLAFADCWLKGQGFSCVTTVPARADLHAFFGQNGFEECFALEQRQCRPDTRTDPARLESASAAQYGLLREKLLAGRDHVAYAPAALEYQAGTCALSGGGLYRVGETGCACVEVAGDEVFVKELLLAEGQQRQTALSAIAKAHPAGCYWVRTPYARGEKWAFAMVKWLIPRPAGWDGETAYLGLAFD
ncbi:MAG: GNAT family N-acetyltransferase [Oscillospiraceae bacterium]|nr:GNAT family N-acetyltransferase [Oscillospiraceae bacterium]